MKSYLSGLFLLVQAICLPFAKCLGNVYVVIYATAGGKTGHAGIAVDNYEEHVFDDRIDTVRKGTMTYFDLWPLHDDFKLGGYSANRAAKFYKLPNHQWPESITLSLLYDKGLPHKEFYPCDALLMIRTSPVIDFRLIRYLDSILEKRQWFNARFYNCSDFVRQALLQVISGLPHAREFIPLSFSTTPNKLCRRLIARKDIIVLKQPGSRIKRNFFWAKIVKRLSGQLFTAHPDQLI